MSKKWRIAKALEQLLAELNSHAPNRSKLSDGAIGDAAHASRTSDHNPWVDDGGMGVVTARDFTHDPAHGADMNKIVAHLVKRRDPRIKYIIWNWKMWRSYDKLGVSAWTPTDYTGSNGHTKHAHVSVNSDKASYDSTATWGLSKGLVTIKDVGPSKDQSTATPHSGQQTASRFEKYREGIELGSRIIKEGSAGNDVKWVQAALGVRADGYFGSITEDTVIHWQKAHKLTPDGIVGPLTWKSLKAFMAPKNPNKPAPQQPNPQPPAVSHSGFVKNGRTFPSQDGYPVFAQGYDETTSRNEDWGIIVIASGTGRTVSAIGCAMTAVCMALSGITGRTITPDEMATFMKSKNGFGSGGDIQSWDLMGTLVSPQVDLFRKTGFTADKIDQELDAGRPVIVHVDYVTKNGAGKREGKYDGTGDHWFLVTGRSPDKKQYRASDPALGRKLTLHRMADGRLEADVASKYGTKYRTVGNAVTFSRGPAVRVADNKGQTHIPKTHTTTSSTKVVLKPTQTGKGSKLPANSPLPAFSGADRDGTVKAIHGECLRQGVTMLEQIAYVLATVQLETGHFQPIREADYLGAKAEGYRKSNLRYYPYYGRGYVQLTWKENYEKYSKLLGVDMVKNPDLALRPDVALFVLVHGMKKGIFTGASLSTYINASRVDFRGARAIINGSDRASDCAEYARQWLSALKMKKVG
ncbi:MAG TPA: peptidoglycan-binding protein [Archangium sp.]|nr:peptidoglycan-binding protein [Archangium sp.]